MYGGERSRSGSRRKPGSEQEHVERIEKKRLSATRAVPRRRFTRTVNAAARSGQPEQRSRWPTGSLFALYRSTRAGARARERMPEDPRGSSIITMPSFPSERENPVDCAEIVAGAPADPAPRNAGAGTTPIARAHGTHHSPSLRFSSLEIEACRTLARSEEEHAQDQARDEHGQRVRKLTTTIGMP